MTLNKIKNNTFHRIGDRYANYFDSDHFMGRSAMDTFDISRPRRNLKQNESSLEIEVALPGFSKGEIELTMTEGYLVVVAEKNEFENYKDRFLRQEFHTDRQERHFALAKEIDQDLITSEFSDGILRIKLPIKPEYMEDKTNRTIEVS